MLANLDIPARAGKTEPSTARHFEIKRGYENPGSSLKHNQITATACVWEAVGLLCVATNPILGVHDPSDLFRGLCSSPLRANS